MVFNVFSFKLSVRIDGDHTPFGAANLVPMERACNAFDQFADDAQITKRCR